VSALREEGGRAPTAGALRAFAELRFRLVWRRLRGRQGVPELVARIVLFVVAIPAGLAFAVLAGLGAYSAVRAGRGIRAEVAVAGVFFGIWQTWTAIALSLSEREGLDLRRLLVYPLPPARLFAYGVVASVAGDPFSVFWCLVLAGAYTGAAVARPGAWLLLLALAYVLFVAATVALVTLLQEGLARALRGRRARVLAIATIYVGTAGLVAWTGGRPAALADAFRVLRVLRWAAFPAAFAHAAVLPLYDGRSLAALPWLAALAGGAAVASFAAYRLALGSALAGEAGAPRAAASGEGGWRLPGRMGALVEKEAKYLLRHPLATLLALILPALAGLVAWKVAPRIPAEAGEVLRALPLLGFALYAHVAAQIFWLNAFGWERGGGRTWFLAPVPAAEVILAKNVCAYVFSLALFAASAGVGIAVAGAPPRWALVAAVALHAGIAPWLLGAGNVVSILNPRAAPLTVQRGGALSPLSSLAGMAIFSAAAGVFSIPVLVALRLDQPWVLVVAWAALGLAGAGAYAALLPAMSRLLERRREPLLEAITGDEE
jgi:ABC-2 type transport system permease protein